MNLDEAELRAFTLREFRNRLADDFAVVLSLNSPVGVNEAFGVHLAWSLEVAAPRKSIGWGTMAKAAIEAAACLRVPHMRCFTLTPFFQRCERLQAGVLPNFTKVALASW